MTQRKTYYFDNNATTRVAPEVLSAMLPFLTEHWGNPSSAYHFGHDLVKHLKTAREQVAALLNADPAEIVFTSCGTESSNTAIQSALSTHPGKMHVVMTAVEHSANIKFGQLLEKRGCDVTYLGVDADGQLDLHALEKAIREDTALVTIMYANNETGVVFPIEEIAAICRMKGVPFHTDAVQVAGKLKLDVKELDVDLLSLSAHKLYAPKGIGMLYVKKRTKFQPYLIGGSQERGRRGGTENVPYIVGFGRAAELAMATLQDENTRVRALRDRMEKGILSSISHTARNGAREPRVPNTSNIGFDGVESEGILTLLDQAGICASSGSACTTGSLEPSHVLTAMGVKMSLARGSIRFSLGIYSTDEEVEYLLKQLPPIIQKLRAGGPGAHPAKRDHSHEAEAVSAH